MNSCEKKDVNAKSKNVFSAAAERIPIGLLNVVIVIGIALMALLIPFLSAKGGFDVRFECGGGSVVEGQRVRYGESVVEPPAPTKEDHVFLGWYYDVDGKEKVDFDNLKVSKSITLYALWKEK